MKKCILSESESKTIKSIKDNRIKQQLIEGFTTNQFMTVDDFCDKLEKLKDSLIEEYNMKYGNNNHNK